MIVNINDERYAHVMRDLESRSIGSFKKVYSFVFTFKEPGKYWIILSSYECRAYSARENYGYSYSSKFSVKSKDDGVTVSSKTISQGAKIFVVNTENEDSQITIGTSTYPTNGGAIDICVLGNADFSAVRCRW